jgi:hypothetical protein
MTVNMPPALLANVNFIQTSPNSDPTDFYVNNFKINLYPFSHNQSSGYIKINSGVNTIKFANNS